MEGSKLHLLLSSLSAPELNRLAKFLKSPYHNDDQHLVRCFAALLPYYKKQQPALPERARLWKSTGESAALTNLRFARLLSDLLKKTEHFLTVERLRESRQDATYFLLDAYNNLAMQKHFQAPYVFAVEQLEKQPLRDSDYFFHRFRLNVQQYHFLENKMQRTTQKNLQETIHSLDVFYLINKLRYSAAVLHYKQFLNMEDPPGLQGLMAQLRTEPPTVPVAEIYYYIVLTLIQPDTESHYQRLSNLLFKHTALLQEDTRKEVFAYTLNYCIRKINRGLSQYQVELFKLYKDALKLGLLLQGKQLNPWDFKNIATVALRNKEYKWTASFLEKYLPLLPKAEQENARTFNQARYFFATAQYDRVLQLLQHVEYSDIFYMLDSKTTLMKTYFELREYQPLLSLKESFRILLRRKKMISPQNRTNYGNFARLLMSLYRSGPGNRAKLEVLKKTISNTQNIADKSWLEDKVNQWLYALDSRTARF